MANLTASGFGPDATFVTVLNGKLFFTDQDNAWVSDAGQGGLFAHNALTANTTLLGDIGGNVVQTASLGSELYFTVRNNADVYNLWKSDGTAAGTQLVKAAPASSDGFLSLTALDGKLYLASDGPAAGLWVSDGTTAGTTEIAQVLARDLTTIGGKLFFMGYDTAHGNEIWSYDPATGVAAITVDADPGSTSSQPYDLTAGPDGSAYFIANDATGRAEVWRVAASGQVSELTSPINGAPFPNGLSTSLTVMGSKIFFGGTDSAHGDGLFVTDGTQVTFLASVSINSGASASVVGGLLYFEGADAVNGSELWVSDGTAAGTHRVTDTEAPSDANASDLTVAGGKVFFSATDGVHGQELWDFNGSGAAQMVTDINPGAGGSAPTDLTAFDGAAYFVASGGGGSQLWRSDGSAAGTVAITSATNGAGPRYLTVDGAKLFFYGSDSTHGAGLFVTDGTAGGTQFLLAYSLADGSAAGANPGFSVAGGVLYFNGPKAGGGFEIWRSDGTLAGTTDVPDATVDNGSNPQHLTALLPPLAGALDLDGQGRGDLLIQNAVGAAVVGEVGAGGQASFAQVSALGPEWKFVGGGDFMDHGRADFLIQNASGAVDLGEIGAGGQASYVQVAALGPEWSFKGTGDFLGHGDDQFLILNTDGAVYVGEANSGQAHYAEVGALGPEWLVQGDRRFPGRRAHGFPDPEYRRRCGVGRGWGERPGRLHSDRRPGSGVVIRGGWGFPGRWQGRLPDRERRRGRGGGRRGRRPRHLHPGGGPGLRVDIQGGGRLPRRRPRPVPDRERQRRGGGRRLPERPDPLHPDRRPGPGVGIPSLRRRRRRPAGVTTPRAPASSAWARGRTNPPGRRRRIRHSRPGRRRRRR